MNFVVVSLDCVRPEALSCYPESFPYLNRVPYRAATPRIDELAADGLVFGNAFAQAPFTPASHASLFTGLNPYRHGVRGMFDYKLNDGVETMAERFSEAGYATGGFIGAHALSSQYGLDRGFDTYDEEFESAWKNWVVGNRRPCTEVTSKALAWLDGRDRPFVLFVHYFDAHDGGDTPADAGGGTDAESTGLRGLYDAYGRTLDEAVGSPIKRAYRALTRLDPNRSYGRRYHLRQVRRIDEQVGRLVDALRDRGEYEETTVVVLADHGESFGEHGEYGHRKYIYDPTVRIPLVVKPAAEADLPGGVYDDVVRSIDVFPTLADAADIPTPAVDGESLYRTVRDDHSDLKAYAETRLERSPERLDDLVTDLAGIRDRRWKLIRSRLDGSVELYDVANDPGEQENVADERPRVREELVTELEKRVTGSPDKDANRMTDAERAAIEENLEGLGYLESDPSHD